MLIDVKESCLLVVDIQEKLTPKMHEAEKLIQNCQWLLKAATLLNIPTLGAEQYPQGLGSTIPQIQEHLPPATPVLEKVSFSCAADKKWLELFQQIDKPQALIIGIETHVCVLQTALELLAEGVEVYVVADAVSARTAEDHRYALDRMNGEGVIVVTKEMVLFEWLRRAGNDTFKKLTSALF